MLAGAPLTADWRMLNGAVEHVFTHFKLQLALAASRVDRHSTSEEAIWWPVESLDQAGLPTVFAKAARAIGECG